MTRFGPVLDPEGVILRCWAPGAREAEAVLDPGTDRERRLLLEEQADGFFSGLASGAGPGLRYLFARDGGPPLPDPASRWQPEGVFGPSEVVDLAFPFGDGGWRGVAPEELVVYELHLGTFSEEGTCEGAEAHLDELRELGVTALEIMPVAAFPGRRGWGYDGTFHFAPFAGYGPPRALQHLVDACHARGLAVLLDVVTNHFGPEGNAMWGLAPLFFRPDRPTAWSSGINWEADPVLAYFEEMAAFWAREYHLDGLRLDAFHAVPAEARGPHLQRMLSAVERELGPGRRFTALLESVDNQASLLEWPDARVHITQLNFDYQRASHALLTGERHGEYQDFQPAEVELERVLGSGFAFLGRFSAHHRRVRGEARPPRRWDGVVSYLQNHDTVGNRYLGQRLDALTDPEALRAATALLLLHPGVPFLFMGQEWAATTPFYFFTDLPEGLMASVKAGRRAGFRELDPARCSLSAPGCDEEEALRRSLLRWEERGTVAAAAALARFRELLAVRRRVRPRMSDLTCDTRVRRDGRLFSIRVAAADDSDGAFVIFANLQGAPAPLPVSPGTLLYSTCSLDGGALPPWSTALFHSTR